MLKKDKAICIRTTDYSENSQILTFFGLATGKLGVIAKGSKKAKSFSSGPIQLCSAGDIVFTARDDDKLATLTEFNPTFFGLNIRKKLLALNCAVFAAEALNLSMKEFDPHPEIFMEMTAFLQRLDEDDDSKTLMHLFSFELALLNETGSMPVCDGCVNCRRKFGSDWKEFYFSSSASGFICRDCEPAFADRRTITAKCAGCMNSPARIQSAENATMVELQNLFIEYITYLLERPPRTAMMILKLINAGR